MTPSELIDYLRSRINPAYAAQLGTESHERRLCAEALEALISRIIELEAVIKSHGIPVKTGAGGVAHYCMGEK
jgi:hypothetical protein